MRPEPLRLLRPLLCLLLRLLLRPLLPGPDERDR